MRTVTPVRKESYYQGQILRWLRRTYPAAFVWKVAAGPYCQGGIPDICMVLEGHAFFFEVKRPGVGRLSKLQEIAIQRINAAGGSAAVVSSIEQAREIIEQRKAKAERPHKAE